MDALTAIGLASAIVQFIDFGFKVAKRLEEFESKNPGECPRSLQAICTQLPLLLNSLNKIKSDTQIQKLDFDTKCILRGVVSGCTAQIVQVEAMVNEVSRAPGDSFKVKIKKVFKSLKYDEKAAAIERNLHTYMSVLILHHVVDSADAPLPLLEDTFFDVREKRVSPFVERSKLMGELESGFYQATRSQSKTPIILRLVGNKGVGKTQLAVEYCYQAHSLGQFRSIFWLDASSLENLYFGLEGIYATIRRATGGSRSAKIGFVTSFLNDLWHPWLLVLDNYEPAAVYNEIMELLPSRGHGGILLVTREQAKDGLGDVVLVQKFLTSDEQSQLNSQLIAEVQRKNEDGIMNAVFQGAEVNSLIWDKWPCLHRAVLFGLENTVKFLLEQGANPNIPCKTDNALYWAASEGHQSICDLILDNEDASGFMTSPMENQAAFNTAATNGHVDVVQTILNRREVTVNAKNQFDETPMECAAKGGHTEMVRFLIAKGALLEDHSQGSKALINATHNGHIETVKTLCTDGKVDPNEKDGDALYHAAILEDTVRGKEIAVFLFSKGANPDHPSMSDSPLHGAALYGRVDMIRLLLDRGADPTRECHRRDALTLAIESKTPASLPLLLRAKISNAAARNAWLARGICLAGAMGEREAVLSLLQAGADINAVTEEGSRKGATPLLQAIFKDQMKTAQLLIRKGARQDISDESGRLPLPLAAKYGHNLVVRDLIRNGGDLNIKTGPNEDTPLMLASVNGHEKVVKVLIENGADIDAMNKFGDTALDLAEEKEHEKIIQLLSC